jgi:hypothetical protein
MEKRHHQLWHTVREYATHWTIAGAILAVTGAAPDHWLAALWQQIPVPAEAIPRWLERVDYRLWAVIAGLTIVVGDTLWRHHSHPASVTNETVAPTIAAVRRRHSLTNPRSPSCRSSTSVATRRKSISRTASPRTSSRNYRGSTPCS